jgi:hypothetical protein
LGWGPTIGKAIQRLKQNLEHAVDVRAHVRVREPDSRIAPAPVDLVANAVGGAVMCIAIDFDDERFSRAEEIDDTIADHVLAPELVPAELRTAEPPPENGLERCAPIAQPSGSIEQLFVLRQ